MTKREFVEQWVLRHSAPVHGRHEVKSVIYNANLVWDLIGEEIAPDPPPQRSGYIERLFDR